MCLYDNVGLKISSAYEYKIKNYICIYIFHALPLGSVSTFREM